MTSFAYYAIRNVSVTFKDPLGPFMCVSQKLVTNIIHCNVGDCMNMYQRRNTLLVEDVKHELNGCLSWAHVCMI